MQLRSLIFASLLALASCGGGGESRQAEAPPAAPTAAEAVLPPAHPQGPAALPRFLDLSRAPDPQARIQAIEELGRLTDWWAERDEGALVVRRLAEGLLSPDEEERRKCLSLLPNAGPHASLALEALERLLRSAEGAELEEAAYAARILGEVARPLVPVLIARLLSAQESARSEVAFTLNFTGGGEEDARRLVKGLATGDADFRRSILGILHSWNAYSTLRVADLDPLLSDEDEDLQKAVLRALLHVPGGEVKAAAIVIRRAAEDPNFAHHHLWDLRDLGPRFAAALPWLLKVAKTGGPRWRAAAVNALMGAPLDIRRSVLPTLEEALEDSDNLVRTAAAWALFWPEEPLPNEGELIDQALTNTHSEVRRIAVMTLGNRGKDTGDLKLASKVAGFLYDSEPDVRFWAGNTLEEIGTAPPWAITAVRENLKSRRRLVRLGAIRAARVMGPAAASAVPELLRITRDPDLGGFALVALAATGVMNDEIERALFRLTITRRSSISTILENFGKRAGFLVEPLRQKVLDKTLRMNLLPLVAAAAPDPDEMAHWLIQHEKLLNYDIRLGAYRAVGLSGLEGYVRASTAMGTRRLAWARAHVRRIGPAAIGPLVSAATILDEWPAATAAELLGEFAAEVKPRQLVALLASPHPRVRAAAARTAAKVLRAGADPAILAPNLADLTGDEDASVRAGSLHALAAAGRAPAKAAAAAQRLLTDPDAAVRVGAAEAVFHLTGETAGPLDALRAVLAAPTPSWGVMTGGGTPARTEDSYSEEERAWASAARALGRMGPSAAPLAQDLLWAALRHGGTRMQKIMVDAVAEMGPGARAALPLLRRMETTCQKWRGHLRYERLVDELEAALSRAEEALR